MRRPTLVASTALISFSTLTACSRGVSRVETVPLPHRNPTEYVFDASLDEVHRRAGAALRAGDAPTAVFGRHEAQETEDLDFADYFAVEDGKDAVFGRDVLSAPGNEHDLYVHTYGTPLWPTPVYRGSRGPLPFVAAFHVHLASEGDVRTRVSVRALDATILNGLDWGLGSCGFGYAWRHVRVAPTSVEEYALLRYIGRAVGEAGMPRMVLPRAR